MEYKIQDIETLTEDEVKELAIEKIRFKDTFDLYFVDFKGYFGYSVLVFLNGGHIYYANDYQLHHQTKDKEELRELYLSSLQNKIFSEQEILDGLKETEAYSFYDDYEVKRYYLSNYYPQQKDYVSCFFIVTPETKKEFEKAKKGKHYNPISYCYMDDPDFIQHQMNLYAVLSKQRSDLEKTYDYMYKAFLKEFYNHEYSINWQGNWDVLSCFGRIDYVGDDVTQREEILNYFDQLDFNEDQRKAFWDARQEYMRRADDLY